MASKTKRTRIIRKRKMAPNPKNLRADALRIQENARVLEKLAHPVQE